MGEEGFAGISMMTQAWYWVEPVETQEIQGWAEPGETQTQGRPETQTRCRDMTRAENTHSPEQLAFILLLLQRG